MDSRYKFLDQFSIQQEVEKTTIVTQYYQLERDYNQLLKHFEDGK